MGLHSDTAEDVATVSNFREVEVKHYHLAVTVNFEKQEINGSVSLICQALQTSLEKVILDVHETLSVHKVTVNDSEDAGFSVEPFTGYGTALHIKLSEPLAEGSEFAVTIEYTATNGPGVCWLKPAQTAGKVKPYMYTQGQAVCNRSFFPCQDTPAVKCPYSAEVMVPEGFTAVMSCCISSCEAVTKDDRTVAVYSFSMPHSIQAYLVALAVGDLQSADIGPRSRVWTEPSQLDKAKAEFDGVVEEFITTGEGLFGPYVWDRYDILVMPPSFPYGGMENPCMTFVTPCILVGDKSLTDVVIHEISHSWFGNLVTNANWSEFWLNEGFTMFAQRRIMEKIFGRAYTCLETKTGLALLKQHMDESGHDHPLNRLRVIIEPGVDPDDTYNETPYEKGYSFVCYLQHLAGSVEEFDDFLKAYVDKYKFKSIVAEDALEFFLEYFPKLKEQGVDKREGFEFHSMWLNTPGWPVFTPDLSAGQELTEPAETLADKWAAETEQPITDDITAWKTYQVLHFLDSLLAKEKFPEGALSKMEAAYPSISNTHNAEIRVRWSQITVKNQYDKDLAAIREFLHSQGKQKYTLPVYKALVKGTDAAKKLATDVFTETKEQLHVNVQNYVNKILSKE